MSRNNRSGPSFLLRNIDPQEILAKYLSGYYSSSNEDLKSINIAKVENVFDQRLSSNPEDPVYIIQTKNLSNKMSPRFKYSYGKLKSIFTKVNYS